jgi:hypothetical protein
MTDQARVAEVLVSAPEGACFPCLAEKTGLDLGHVTAAVEAMSPVLVTYFGFATCVFCGERRRLVSIFRAP